MKNNKVATFVTIASVIIACFLACRKNDPDILEKKDLKPSTFRSSGCSMDGISLECRDVPHFATAALFESTINCLETDYDNYNDSIESHFSSLSDDAFNDTLDALGIDDEQPLEDFENTLGYVSLRHALRISEDTWLDNSTLVDANDPIDNNPIGDDPVMSTLFNEYGEVMIGDTIYKYMSDGTLLSIVNGSCATLDSLRDGLITEDNMRWTVRNITFNSDTLACQTDKKDGGKYNYATGKSYKWKISIHTAFFGSTAKASTRSFKQKNNGHWKRFKTHVGAEVYGTLWNNICTESDTTNMTKVKRRSKVVARKFEALTTFKTETGHLHSYHECSSTSVNSLHDLTW